MKQRKTKLARPPSTVELRWWEAHPALRVPAHRALAVVAVVAREITQRLAEETVRHVQDTQRATADAIAAWMEQHPGDGTSADLAEEIRAGAWLPNDVEADSGREDDTGRGLGGGTASNPGAFDNAPTDAESVSPKDRDTADHTGTNHGGGGPF